MQHDGKSRRNETRAVLPQAQLEILPFFCVLHRLHCELYG